MSSTRKKLLCKPVVVNIGCGCRRPTLYDVFHCKPKTAKAIYGRRNQVYQANSSSSLEQGDGHSRGTISPDLSLRYYPHQPEKTSKAPAKRSGRIRESVAVVKESDDPYLDFRQSMLQMILEKEIYAKEDLRELLNCFLSLNSPQHHQIIIRAFTEIWKGVLGAPGGVRRPGKVPGTWESHVGKSRLIVDIGKAIIHDKEQIDVGSLNTLV